MADPQGTPQTSTNQVSTLDVGPAPASIPTPPPTPGTPTAPEARPLPETPPSPGMSPRDQAHLLHTPPKGDLTDHDNGLGVEGEEPVWEGGYSIKNFLGRIAFRAALLIAWFVLAIATWGYDQAQLQLFTILFGVAVLILTLGLVGRILQAKMGHSYRLTTRRLFVSTGVFRRERDQMELLQVSDVFTRQGSLTERWFGVGTVVVTSSNKQLPTFNLLGVDDPKGVMDLIWHHARAEQDKRSVRVNQI